MKKLETGLDAIYDDQAFRDWLAEYTRRDSDLAALDALYKRLSYVSSGGRKFTREEMNER